MTRIYEGRRPAPDSVIVENYTEDVELGVLKRGKEADVWLVERHGADRSCLLAYKKYVRPEARAFRNNAQYHAHQRNDGLVRDNGIKRRPAGGRADQLAMDKRTTYGKELLHKGWMANEWTMLRRLYEAGVNVPYPVEQRAEGVLMQYVGDADYAAPRLANARVEGSQLPALYEQLRENLRAMARAGVVHGDLSAYNVLLWQERIWIIDVPQAVPFLDNLSATDFLHRDVTNIGEWFVRKGLEADPEDLFVDLLNVAFDYKMEDMFFSHGS